MSLQQSPVILDIAYHRNGICGAPFHVILFQDPEMGRMVGVVFDQPYHVAVFNLDKLAENLIAFGVNAWRGDWYEPSLRKAIAKYQVEQSQLDTTPPSPVSTDQITRIAQDHLGILTLQERRSDSLDFHLVSVWAVHDALTAAYQAGRAAGEEVSHG